jgi:putative membrane protein
MDVFGGLFGAMMVASIVLPLVITGAVIGVVIWAIRRSVPAREDAAVAELRQRYARGEISPAEFEVRLRSLTQDR